MLGGRRSRRPRRLVGGRASGHPLQGPTDQYRRPRRKGGPDPGNSGEREEEGVAPGP